MNPKEVSLALELADSALMRGRWTKLHVDNKKVVLEVGPINFDGSRQSKTATYRFYTDMVGLVHYVTDTHP